MIISNGNQHKYDHSVFKLLNYCLLMLTLKS